MDLDTVWVMIKYGMDITWVWIWHGYNMGVDMTWMWVWYDMI